MAVHGEDAIDLFWKAPENTGEPPVTSYRIERAVDYDGTQDPTYRNLGCNCKQVIREREGPSETGILPILLMELRMPMEPRSPTRSPPLTPLARDSPSNADGAISSNKALMPRNLTATVADDMEKHRSNLGWTGSG